MASPCVRNNGVAGPRPHLPAFCRSRRAAVTFSHTSPTGLRVLLGLGLLVQLSTLLLVIAGPVPPRPTSSAPNTFGPRTDVAPVGAAAFTSPLHR